MKFIWFKRKHLKHTKTPGHYTTTSSSSVPSTPRTPVHKVTSTKPKPHIKPTPTHITPIPRTPVHKIPHIIPKPHVKRTPVTPKHKKKPTPRIPVHKVPHVIPKLHKKPTPIHKQLHIITKPKHKYHKYSPCSKGTKYICFSEATAKHCKYVSSTLTKKTLLL